MILIFGGTGTLGYALAKIIRQSGYKCTIVSRCELRQKEMHKLYPEFRYILGDISSHEWKRQITTRPYIVFNLAALKHVDIAENNVEACLRVNLQGTINTADWAMDIGVPNYVFSSTDKAVLPVNTYGMCKAISEKYLYAMQGKRDTKFSVFRWANVLGSRGSVLQIFKESLLNEGVVKITDPRMTRFWLSIEDVAQFMWDKKLEETAEIPHIPPMKASTLEELAIAVAEVVGVPEFKTVYTGIRPGEKIHECMISNHEYCMNSNTYEKYSHDELVALVRRVL
jgi:FlaA1/EpsC-like NDP-sugar epimerase